MTRGFVAHLRGRALGDLAAEVEHDDLVGDRHDHRHVVLDEQHAEVELVAHRPDQLAELVDLGVREPGRGLVEQQQPGPGRERARDLDALERAVRQADRGPRREVVEREPLAGSRAPRRGASRSRGRACNRRRARCRAPTSAGKQREVLERPRDPDLRDAVRGHAQEVVAVELDRAARRVIQAAHAVEQRGLARAVRADRARRSGRRRS